MVDILRVFQVDVFPLFLGMMVAIIGGITKKDGYRLYSYIYIYYLFFGYQKKQHFIHPNRF